MLSLGKLIHPLLICFTGPDGVFADGRWFLFIFLIILIKSNNSGTERSFWFVLVFWCLFLVCVFFLL